MIDRTTNSILAVDFGSVYTRVVVIDIVDGEYRLVARGVSRTTDGYPANDIMVGFRRVLDDLSESMGRTLMSQNGTVITPEKQDRSGVDLFAVTASIGRPLRAVVVGLVPDVSIASAIRAASGTYIDIAAVVSLDDGRSEQDRLNAILLNTPDVIILTGGTEQGATKAVLEMAELVRRAVSLIEKPQRPSVVYSGNSKLQSRIGDVFESAGEKVVNLLVAENVRPSLDHEDLESAQLQLGRAFDRYKEVRSKSFAQLGAMSQTGLLPTGQSYTFMAEYLGVSQNQNVALLDIGSSSSTLAVSVDGQVSTRIRTDIGLGHSAPALLETVGIEEIRQWLPFNISQGDLVNYVMNKTLRPAGVPMTFEEVGIEHALLRAGARYLFKQANPQWQEKPPRLDRVIGAGSALTNTGNPAYDALLLIDAVQPNGVTMLQSDPYGLIAAMGVIALHTPEAVIHMLEAGNLTQLGTCITVNGRIRPDRQVLQIKVSLDDGEVIEEEVMGGHLWVLPLGAYEIANVKIRCSSETSVNGKRSVELEASGGLVGLIVDARGRPTPLGDTVAERATQMPQWVHEMTDDPLQEVDPALLEETPEEQAVVVTAGRRRRAERPQKPPRRRRRGGGRRRGKQEAATQDADDDIPGFDDFIADLDTFDDGKTTADDELDELRDVLS